MHLPEMQKWLMVCINPAGDPEYTEKKFKEKLKSPVMGESANLQMTGILSCGYVLQNGILLSSSQNVPRYISDIRFPLQL